MDVETQTDAIFICSFLPCEACQPAQISGINGQTINIMTCTRPFHKPQYSSLPGVKPNIELFRGHYGQKGKIILSAIHAGFYKNKQSVLNQLAQYFAQPRIVYKVFFNTHGLINGNLLLDNGEQISFLDVIKCYRKSASTREGKVLHLIVDSCYSGAWISQARSNRFDFTIQDGKIVIWASCCRNKISKCRFDGSFLFKLYFQGSQEIRDHQQDHIYAIVVKETKGTIIKKKFIHIRRKTKKGTELKPFCKITKIQIQGETLIQSWSKHSNNKIDSCENSP